MASEPLPNPIAWPRPRAAKAALPALPDYLPARMLNEFVYCPRLFFYEWVDGLFAHNADTVEGGYRHARVDKKRGTLPEAEALDTDEPIHSTSVEVSSDSLGLIAKIDLVEADEGCVVPVDYKKGSPKEDEDGLHAWPADRVQSAVQALVLRDAGYRCDEAIVFYSATKQRIRVSIDETLVEETMAALAQARSVAVSGQIPPPLVDSPKCPRCSLVTICLPDETRTAAALEDIEPVAMPMLPFDDAAPASSRAREEARRLVPARDDLRPLYITGHGLTVGLRNEILQVRDRGGVIQEARLMDVSQLNVFGNVQVTAAAIEGLCRDDKPVAHFSTGGWLHAVTRGMTLKNVFLRRAQFRRADDEAFCVLVARDLVATKIRNQRTLLQRNHLEPPARALELLKRLAHSALRAESLDTLLGIEGTAARTYFEQFSGMIKVDDDKEERPVFEFAHRNRRPPRDPVNAMLSLAYAMLTRDLVAVCHAVGFDPYIGYFHQPRFGRPALALDLMEGFRPLLADSAALMALNSRMVRPGDFAASGGAVALTAAGRKGLLRAYEQRLDQLVTHPVFGYRVSYRRVLEIQVRLFARVVEGELSRYPGFETR
ncbi:MAG TPA: CRISPR-associated endonuclease Cas1 [Vicinamibacterales bacterium]